MQHNGEIIIKTPIPFLQERTIMFVGNHSHALLSYITQKRHTLQERFNNEDYQFLFLPDLIVRLDKDLLEYMFPGNDDLPSVNDMYQRIRVIAHLGDNAGFLYKKFGTILFHALPDSLDDSVEAGINDLIGFLNEIPEPEEEGNILFRMSSDDDICFDFDGGGGGGGIDSVIFPSTYDANEIRFSIKNVEEPLSERTQEILRAWEKLEEEYGITIDELEILLGFRIKLSPLHITTSGKIILTDWNGGTEVKMDDRTKALYFFYLRHPEGVAQKDVIDYREEILRYYTGISGRGDQQAIERSLDNLLAPYGNDLNISLSRIKKAFKDIVGDRVAKSYYVDGRYAEPRKIVLDRDLVIWEH